MNERVRSEEEVIGNVLDLNQSSGPKKRRKKDKDKLIPDVLAINDVRRNYHKIFEKLGNGLNEDEFCKELRKICADPDKFILVLAIMEIHNPFGPAYNEIIGVGMLISFYNIVFFYLS